jgi:excisionase family DNA binding protein
MPIIIMGIKFYTIPETAKALRVSYQTIRAWIKQGRIKGQRIGRPILISENNLKDFFQINESDLKKEIKPTDRLIRIANITLDYYKLLNPVELTDEGFRLWKESLEESIINSFNTKGLKGSKEVFQRFLSEIQDDRLEEFLLDKLTEEDYRYWIMA